MEQYFFTGSYQSEKEISIRKFAIDTKSGALRELWAVGGVENPSYVLPHPDKQVLYSVEEIISPGMVAVYSLKNGTAEYIKSVPCKGADPCHLCLDPAGEHLVVSNYSGGSLAVFRLDEDGIMEEMTEFIEHRGGSVFTPRQNKAHVHFAAFVGEDLFSCDLGEDRIYAYHLDSLTGKLLETPQTFAVPEGYGPRHFATHARYPARLYAVSELEAKVIVYGRKNESYAMLQERSTMPEETDKESIAVSVPRAFGAAVKWAFDGEMLLVSTRGADVLTAFRMNEDGSLAEGVVSPCGGKTPRDFHVFGSFAVVANQDEDRLSVLHLDKHTGRLEDTGQGVTFLKPTCVVPAQDPKKEG